MALIRYWARVSPVAIWGIEVQLKQGHLLVLGITEVIPAGLDVVATVDIARRMGALLSSRRNPRNSCLAPWCRAQVESRDDCG